MGLGSYQDPGEEIGGKTTTSTSKSTSSSSSKSSGAASNPSSLAGYGYVSNTPSAAKSVSSGSAFAVPDDSGSSGSRASSLAGQGYVPNTPSAAARVTSGSGDSSPLLPIGGGLMPTVAINDAGGFSMLQRSSRLTSLPVSQTSAYAIPIPVSGTAYRAELAAPVIGASSTLKQIEDYIRSAAEARGIDPDTAVKVAKSEGLNSLTKASEAWQSTVKKNGVREPSYTPFQLLVGGGNTGFPVGLGNEFVKETGLDPSKPENVQAAVDFALDFAAENGWSSWYGAKSAGISANQGLENAKAIGINVPAPYVPPETQLASGVTPVIPATMPSGMQNQQPVQVVYQMGPNRPNQPKDEIISVISGAAGKVLGNGATVIVTSGTEDEGKQYGSNRHKTGLAADVQIMDAAGNVITADDPRMVQIAKVAAADGAKGIGFGSEYMGGDHIHIDMVEPGKGQDNAWGTGGNKIQKDLVALMNGAQPVQLAGGLIPTPADRPTQAVSATGTGSASSGRQQSEVASAQAFRDKYIEPKQETGLGKKLVAGAIDVGAGLVPGVGMAASLYNTGAAITGSPTIGQRIVNNSGTAQVASNADRYEWSSSDDGDQSSKRVRLASSWDGNPASDPVSDFESRYIRPQLYDGGWQTPQEKWGTASA